MRRLLELVLFGVVLAGAAAVTWQATGQAKLVEDDLASAQGLPPGPAASGPVSWNSAWP